MPSDPVQRRLAAILAADVAGYSRLMGEDEEGTLATLTAHLADLIEPCVAEHRGRVVKTTGDGLLAEFASVVDAVRCAVAFQEGMVKRNMDMPEERRIEFRIGVNLGDVIVQDDDVYGDGVNVAARLEGLAEPSDIVVSGTVHEHVRGKLELVFDDFGPQEVKNIAEPVRAFRVRHVNDLGSTPRPRKSPKGVLGRPAVAVLPFDNLSGDPEQDYVGDGLAEDIITSLSLCRAFPVIARNSTFAYKGQSLDVRKFSADLKARYVIEGSVRKGGTRVRVTAQLIDAELGHQVWTEKYEREMEDVFALQDEIATQIAVHVAPEVQKAEQRRLRPKNPSNLDAWECYQRGVALFHEFTERSNGLSREILEKAIELDPSYSRPWSYLALTHHIDLYMGFAPSRHASLAKAIQCAERAVELDDTDSFAHRTLGMVVLWTGDYDFAMSKAHEALALNPSDAGAYVTLGAALDFIGRHVDGIESYRRALELNPRDPRTDIYFTMLARAQLNAGDYESAVASASKAMYGRTNLFEAHLIVASSLAHMGRENEARQSLAKAKDLGTPEFELPPGWRRYKDATNIEHLMEGLRKAGLPE